MVDARTPKTPRGTPFLEKVEPEEVEPETRKKPPNGMPVISPLSPLCGKRSTVELDWARPNQTVVMVY
jgi:hypothetical protein